MNYLYRAYVSHNPGGIEINLGYYALAECIIKGTFASTALLRWCGLWFDKGKQKTKEVEYKKHEKPMGRKTKRILELYRKNPKMTNRKIAKLADCTPEMVSKTLHNAGIRRNSWNGFKKDTILELYRKNPKMGTREIAEIAECSPEAVSKIFRNLGIRKNRWDNHVSKDPRYSKEKRSKK